MTVSNGITFSTPNAVVVGGWGANSSGTLTVKGSSTFSGKAFFLGFDQSTDLDTINVQDTATVVPLAPMVSM